MKAWCGHIRKDPAKVDLLRACFIHIGFLLGGLALVDEALACGNVLISPEFDELELVYRRPPENWTFINTFTPVISEKYNQIGCAIEALKAHNCNYAEMSGSGSTVFGVFTSRQEAESVVEKLSDSWNCKLARTV